MTTRLIIDEVCRVTDEISVSEEEHHYLTRVRRHRAGDDVEIRDRQGNCFGATVLNVERRRALLRVEKHIAQAAKVYPVRLIVAVPKRNLLDDVVRKGSEIGIDTIVPVVTERSVMNPGPDKVVRWRKIAVESLRQCGRERPLTVEDIQSLDHALNRVSDSGTAFILHPDVEIRSHANVDSRLRGNDKELSQTPTHLPADSRLRGNDRIVKESALSLVPPITVAIGPEGGFTDDEVEKAVSFGFRPRRFQMPILRVETAAIATAVLLVASLSGENAFM